MNFDGGYAGLTSGQYRAFLAGFCVPLMTALFGIVLPCFVMATGDIAGSPLFVLVPGFVLAGWTQVEVAIAGGRNIARATGAKRRIRSLLIVPIAMVPVALLTSVVGVIRAPGRNNDLLWCLLVAVLIGAAFLPFTVRARRMPWLQA